MTTTPTLWGSEVTFSNFFTDFNPQVSARRDNSFDIVWQRSGGDLVGRHLNEFGSFVGGDYLAALSASTPKDLYAPKVFQQSNGQVVVAYSELASSTQGDVRWHAVNEAAPDASSVPTEFLNQVDETLMDVTLLESGGSAQIVGLQNVDAAFSPYLGLRFVGPNGTPTSGRIILDFDSNKVETNTSITELQTQDVAVVYEQFDLTTFERQVMLQIYTQGGVNVRSAVPVSLGGANAAFPDVALLSNATFIVTWQQADGLAFRTYLANGNPVDATPRVIPGSLGGFLPKITSLNDGGFIVAWTKRDGLESDGSAELDMYLQRFNAQGNQIGDQIHLDKPGDQSVASIATLYDGRVIITYSSETGDATNVTTLRYQIFDPRENTIIGSEGADDNIVGRIDGSTIFGLAGNDRLTGMGASDRLEGGAGNDRLDGGGGNDIMVGGLGDDLYVVDSSGDVVTELAGEGIDTVRTALTNHTLAANVENLFFLGAPGNLTGIGNAIDNRIVTAAGNDTLDGRGGDDTMIGGLGNDTYIVDSRGDVVVEERGGGVDTIRTTLTSYSLANVANVENLTFTGTGSFAGTGNGLANVITGGAGSDALKGAAGNDRLIGGGGADVLMGGFGKDTLIGGGGADRFDFNSIVESLVGADRDVISGFSRTSGDRIDLQGIDASTVASGNQAFSFIGNAAFSGAAGQLRFARIADGLVVSGDVNGDRVADVQIELTTGLTSMVAGDFLL